MAATPPPPRPPASPLPHPLNMRLNFHARRTRAFTATFYRIVAAALILALAIVALRDGIGHALFAAALIGACAATNFGFGDLRQFGFRPPQPLPAFNGVGSGTTAVCKLNVGPAYTYDGLSLYITKDSGSGAAVVTLANLGTDVQELQLVKDSRIIRRITPALLLDYLQDQNLTDQLTNGAATVISSAYIPFALASRRDVVGEEANQLGTANVGELLLNVVMKATGATYTIEGHADVTSDNPRNFGIFEGWDIDSFDIINGAKVFNTIPTTDDIFEMIFHASTITKCVAKVGDREVFNATKAQIEQRLRTYGQGVLTANYFPMRWDYTRQFTDRLATATRDPAKGYAVTSRIPGLSVEITATAASTINALRRTLIYS